MITLHDVGVVYRSRSGSTPVALSDLSLRIERGEWVGIAGPNGSGKTTLLKLLAGVQAPTSGSISWDNGGAPSASMMLQDPDNQFVTVSVMHELRISGGYDDARVRDAINRFDLGDLTDRNPHRLSGGEKQRLSMACVWLEDAELILLDEPSSFLDADSARRCNEFVEALHRDGRTIVWATHDRAELDAAGRVIALAPDPAPAEPPSVAEPADGPPALRLDGVSFSYGERTVLRDVVMSVRPGECVGVTGANASGKTTLLLAAGGALRIAGGRIERFSRRAFYVPQSPEQLFFAESVRDELAFGIRRRFGRGADIDGRARAALALAGLDLPDIMARFPFHLSLGEKRRLALAVAVSLEPGILLLDEPTAGLDTTGTAALEAAIVSQLAMGTAVVVASHHRDFLRRITHRILELCDGRLTTG